MRRLSFLHFSRTINSGARKKAILLKDIDIGRSLTVLETQSDVFAVEQQENLVYTGARHGSIARFDTRLSDCQHILYPLLS
ncbi:hypothetical protein PILCRDRAFT_813437 [Piloderma croceum F 1598]|uniref:Uncharacterized protein n=1 Tax=Piloderma croceum (strain F 1598) TaxID=765440 RepID=A0A0C3BSJ3_PILCF|nr:hypothetical protein PILCRDRAFT_813437 [Piloderma croceum F 1598]